MCHCHVLYAAASPHVRHVDLSPGDATDVHYSKMLHVNEANMLNATVPGRARLEGVLFCV